MKLTRTGCIAMAVLTLTSCAQQDQNTYNGGELGHDAIVMFGRVKSVRQVDVLRPSTGTGATVGAVGGGLAESGRSSIISSEGSPPG